MVRWLRLTDKRTAMLVGRFASKSREFLRNDCQTGRYYHTPWFFSSDRPWQFALRSHAIPKTRSVRWTGRAFGIIQMFDRWNESVEHSFAMTLLRVISVYDIFSIENTYIWVFHGTVHANACLKQRWSFLIVFSIKPSGVRLSQRLLSRLYLVI